MGEVARTNSLRCDFMAVIVMLIGVIVVYWPAAPRVGAEVQAAFDYHQLHKHRMTFARDALLGSSHALPAWYPRELLGAPFWSNVQSFPFIPQRVLLLLVVDPESPFAYAIHTCVSAGLAALFTFAFCRRLELGATASATAGWTFACCGYFAARVAAGHLPLLEAYPSLPAILFCLERLAQAIQRRGPNVARRAGLLGMTCGIVMLAGHPQLTIYALIAGGGYAIHRLGGLRAAASSLCVMFAGVCCAGFVLVPMTLLIGRSTRVLAGLAPPNNDLALPYRRMLGWWFPWFDGSVPPIAGGDLATFLRIYPTTAVFWDTVCYVGWAPWIAAAALFAMAKQRDARRILDRKVSSFFVAMSVIAVALALPPVHAITSMLPSTLLRSPSRLLYLTEFSLAIVVAVAIELTLRETSRIGIRGWRVAVAMVVLLHFIDLALFDRHFILRLPARAAPTAAESAAFAARVGDGRVAIDIGADLPLNRRLDDIGFFDSAILARPYRAMMELGEMPLGTNEQQVDGRQLSRRALAAAGVRFVVTTENARDELDPDQRLGSYPLHEVFEPSHRATFFTASRATYLEEQELHERLRDTTFNPSTELLLPISAKAAAPTAGSIAFAESRVRYERPSTDLIRCDVQAGRDGYLRVAESFDAGWSATVDGQPVAIVPALDSMLAVALAPGHHDVRFAYHTPGAVAGIVMSMTSMGTLIILSRRLAR